MVALAPPPTESLPTAVGSASVQLGDAIDVVRSWPSPTTIVVDGPYGVSGYPGDPATPAGLGDWYDPHIAQWTAQALPETTLWFWNTEVGWANTHATLEKHGWEYRSAYIWDKGIAHIAGNVNGKTIRRFPIVTEVCVQYVRKVLLPDAEGELLPIKEWLRSEWRRSGLPLNSTNEACGVKNAATRKYFTQCHLWYFPPPEMMERLADYATEHGKPSDRPYFSLDGCTPLTAEQWDKMRAKWHHAHGVTNVWQEPAVRNAERIKTALKSVHYNQKPLKLMKRIIEATSDEGDVVWEPFGGLCSGAIAAMQTGRMGYAAEMNPDFYAVASERIEHERLALGSHLFD